MIRFAIRAAAAVVLASVTSAAAADPSCEITLRLGNDKLFSSLIIYAGYTNAPGNFQGQGKLVECALLNDRLFEVEDNEKLRLLDIQMHVETVEGPIDILRCTWLPVSRFPVAGDFDLSNQIGAVGVVNPYFTNPGVFISNIECTGTIETTTTTTIPTTTTTIETTTTIQTTTTSTTTLPVPVCGDYDDNGTVTIVDALGALRTSVGLVECELCVCDADGNATTAIGDALRILRLAVGQNVTMSCPDCA